MKSENLGRATSVRQEAQEYDIYYIIIFITAFDWNEHEVLHDILWPLKINMEGKVKNILLKIK